MERSRLRQFAILAAVCLAVQPPTAHAAIVISGDVEPGDANSWSNRAGYVGKTAEGELDVNGGSDLVSITGHIGYEDTATGVMTVDGAGSTWTNSLDLYVGHKGSGTLNISGDGTVLVGRSTYVAYQTGSTGSIHFGPGGGTLTTESLFASPTQLTGIGTIETRGLISDVDLVFDSAADITQTLVLDSQPDQNVTIHLDMADNPDSINLLGAGWKGRGSLAIRDGVTVDSYSGYIAYSSGSTGVATVDGADSTWNNDGELYVGHDGSGTLNISGGGAASVGRSTYVGYEAGSIGSVHFGPGGGTLTTGSLFASPTQLSGTGTINTRGLVSDIDLVFDSTVSLNQTLVFDSQPEQNVTVNLDMAGDPGNSVILGAGWRGHGSLAIRDGVTVNSYGGDIGYASGSTGVATVDGAGSTWTSSYILFVGRRGSGTLNITGGAAVVSRDGFVGGYSGSTGMVTVDGAGSTWANSQSLFIGYFPGSTGVVTVDGSTLAIGHSLYVGRLGDSGTLQISDGGAVSANFSTYVGYSTDSTGLIHFGPGGGTLTTGSLFASPAQFSGTGTVETRGLVSDVDLVLDSTADLDQDLVFDSQPDQNITVHFDMSGDPSNNGELGAGWRGHGSLTVRDGVTVSSSGGYIGHRPGSTGVVTVDGAGSSWTNRSTIYIGRYGSGALNITGGAAVSNKIGYIGSRAGSTGVAIVEGAGSTWINDSTLYVGNYGNGTLNIVVGATVSSRSGVIANVGGSTGVVTVDGAGSKWTNSGKLFIGNSGLATLHITGGGAVSAASVSVYAGSLLAIDIGNDSELAVDGDVVLEPSATLELMLVDTTADGQPEPIEVGGLLDLSAADDAIVPQWQPGPDAASKFGGEYVVAAYGSVDGEFDSVGGGSGPYDIGEAYVAGIDYVTDNRITLSLHPLLDGDADLDGKVWLSDWAALRANFGNMGNGKNWADGNFDPWVDDKVWLSDWAALRANFSNAGYTADGAATVPEPGTIVMLLGAVALALVVGNCKLRAARTMNPSPTPSPPAPLPEGEGSFGSQLCPANHSGVPSRR